MLVRAWLDCTNWPQGQKKTSGNPFLRCTTTWWSRSQARDSCLRVHTHPNHLYLLLSWAELTVWMRATTVTMSTINSGAQTVSTSTNGSWEQFWQLQEPWGRLCSLEVTQTQKSPLTHSLLLPWDFQSCIETTINPDSSEICIFLSSLLIILKIIDVLSSGAALEFLLLTSVTDRNFSLMEAKTLQQQYDFRMLELEEKHCKSSVVMKSQEQKSPALTRPCP